MTTDNRDELLALAATALTMEKALQKIAAGRTIRFTGSVHRNRPLRDKDAQQIAIAALAHQQKDQTAP